MNYFLVGLMLMLSLFGTCSVADEIKDTPHYDVVTEYIRSLGAFYKIQQIASNELQDDKGSQSSNTSKMMSCIRNCTRVKLELNASISALESMRLNKPFDTLIPTTIEWYKRKLKLYDELSTIAKAFLNQLPKPGIDYSSMAARMPEITASLEYIDESIFQQMVLVFALLIDDKPDSEGHVSHLNITKAHKQKLIGNINGLFGDDLEKQNKNWTVSSAALLKAYLLKDYKCIDEW